MREAEKTWLRATEKQALIESFSHTALWPRSAREIKEEDYTLAERLGSLFWLSATSTKSPLTMGLSVSRGIDQKHTSMFGKYAGAMWRSFKCPKSNDKELENRQMSSAWWGWLSMSRGKKLEIICPWRGSVRSVDSPVVQRVGSTRSRAECVRPDRDSVGRESVLFIFFPSWVLFGQLWPALLGFI